MLLKFLMMLFTLLVFSCDRAEVTPDQVFSLELKEVMASAQELKTPTFSPFRPEKISEPVGAWLLTMEIDSEYCLFYKTPLGDSKGVLRLIDRPETGCAESFTENIIVELDQVENLSFIELTHRKRTLGPRQEWEIAGEYRGKAFRWEIFAPLVAEEKGKKPKKLSSFSNRTLKPIEGYDGATKGAYQESYSDGESVFCHRVNENCESVEKFSCQSCRYGWYEVVDYSCPQGGSKICGPSRCGQRGEPACPRGVDHIRNENSALVICGKGSEAGFCEEGLETHCDENNILICL